MKVGFDSQIFRAQRLGGISRYFTELMHEFRASSELEVEVVTPFRYIVNEHLLADQPGRYRSVPGPRAWSTAVGRVMDPRRIGTLDVAHYTAYDTDAIGRLPARATVSTVHDMIPELYPDLFTNGDPHPGKRRFVEDSDLVICVSAATQKHLLDIFACSTPTFVVPLAVRQDFARGARSTSGLADPFVLYVGARGDYKGFDVLVEALGLMGQKAPTLVAAGGGAESERDTALLALHGVVGARILGAVDEATLAGLYAAATCFVMPSRAEGFGLPLLEAMVSGAPVVATDIPVFHEVADQAARYFEAGSASSLAAALAAVMPDRLSSIERERVVSLGVKRAADFSWHRTAQLTRQAYEQALS